MPRCAILVILIFLFACNSKRSIYPQYKAAKGYHYRLISFDENKKLSTGDRALIHASFATQSDSVFWDSENNLNGFYVIEADSTVSDNYLQQHVSLSSMQDSVCLLVPAKVFFQDFFSSSDLPFFSENDSVVKINFKIKGKLSENDEEELVHKGKLKEYQQIRQNFKSEKAYELARDQSGFFWLQKPDDSGRAMLQGETVTLAYKSSFLNGRPLDAREQYITFQLGTPDQVLPGLNYVISRLKMGQNAKIILPSRLAFGEFGSSNGTIPPFTPLLFEVRVQPG